MGDDVSCTGSGVPLWPICIWSRCWHRHCVRSSDDLRCIQRLFGSSSSHRPRSPRSPVLAVKSQEAPRRFSHCGALSNSSLRPNKMVDCGAVSATPQTFQRLVHVLVELCSTTTNHLSFNTDIRRCCRHRRCPLCYVVLPESRRRPTTLRVAAPEAKEKRVNQREKGVSVFNLQPGCTCHTMNCLYRSPSCTFIAQVRRSRRGLLLDLDPCVFAAIFHSLFCAAVEQDHYSTAEQPFRCSPNVAGTKKSLLRRSHYACFSTRHDVRRCHVRLLCWPRRFVQCVARSSRICFLGVQRHDVWFF